MDMKQWQRVLATGATILGLSLWVPAHAEVDRSLKGDKVCTECHDENDNKAVLAIYKGKHGVKADGRTPGCQSCHGASEAHVKTGPKKDEVGGKRAAVDITFGARSKLSSREQSEVCASCHKGDKRTHWNASQHDSADVSCVSCHTNHTHQDKVLKKATQPQVCYTCHQEQRAEGRKLSHHPVGEGKVACSDCHNPHGSAGPKLLKKNTLNETCFTCHAEKRGPFLWEHQPVSEDCSSCHTPHGSNISPLLKSRAPFMCTECHDGPHNSKVPVAGNAGGTQNGFTGVPSENYTGRACMNCHSMVHGSNHPAGALLHR
ncbi:MAG: DmsE family decaheme c-type cytochrome [Azonexus sp.]